MHAVSPQLMVWEPSTLGIPIHSHDIQQHMLSSAGYPVVVPQQPYRPENIQHVYPGGAMPKTQEMQNIVWIQQPNVIAQDDTDANQVLFSQVYSAGAMQFHQSQPNVVPVLMTVNGQRLVVNQPVHQISPPQQPAFCQVATDRQSHEAVRLVNINGVNHTVPHTHQIQSLQQDYRHAVSVQDSQAYMRPRLTPKRRNGCAISPCDTAVNWRNNAYDDRTLSGMNTAQRRRSQSADEDSNAATNPNSSGSPLPHKRIASALATAENCKSLLRSSDPRQIRKLVDIIEYYFSDECLSKNGYMLKQLNNGDSDGYISIRRVAALKRVKAQTRDLRMVAYAVDQSSKLELDKEGMMIRRKRPLPENIEAPRFIRSVVAINLPIDAPTVENVTSLFQRYGMLTQVRVLRPGKAIPSYLKDYTAWVADLGTKVCAVIEFEDQDEAQKACREINMQNRGENSLRVALLKPGARIRRTLYRKYKDEPAEGSDESNDTVSTTDPKDSHLTLPGQRARTTSDSSTEGPTLVADTASANTPDNKAGKPEDAFHYDASISGSDTGSDNEYCRRSIDSAQTPHQTGNVKSTDSGYSQSSSSDEVDSSSSPAKSKPDSTTPDEVSKSAQFCNRLEKNFVDGVPVRAARRPKGPVDDDKGFLRHRPGHN